MENPVLILGSLGVLTFIASTVQSVSGFGFGLLTMPLFLFIFPTLSAIQLALIIGLFISLLNFDLKNLKSILPAIPLLSIVGIGVGLMVLYILGQEAALTVIQVFLLVTIVSFFWSPSKRISALGAFYSSEKIVGIISGFGAAVAAVPGPPLMAFFSTKKLSKIVVLQTTAGTFIFSYLVSLVFSITIFGLNETVTDGLIFLIPFSLAGILLGKYFFSRITEKIQRKVIGSLLGLSLVTISIQVSLRLFHYG